MCAYECIQYTWLILNKRLGFKDHRVYERQTCVPIFITEAAEFHFQSKDAYCSSKGGNITPFLYYS